MKCDQCTRGWVIAEVSDDWPTPCAWCRGRGTITFYRIGQLIAERQHVLKRIDAGRSRSSTCVRVLGAIVEAQAALYA